MLYPAMSTPSQSAPQREWLYFQEGGGTRLSRMVSLYPQALQEASASKRCCCVRRRANRDGQRMGESFDSFQTWTP